MAKDLSKAAKEQPSDHKDLPKLDDFRSSISKPGSKLKELTRRIVRHKGTIAQEVIFDLGDDKKKIVWCLPTFEDAVVNGVPNPLFHVDFEGDVGTDEEANARKEAKKEFDSHYGMTDRVEQDGE